MRWLGLDIGARTIGLAVSDEGAVVATPLRTLDRRGGQRDLAAVSEVFSETSAGGLLVGLPLELSGREGQAARRVRALGDALAAHLSCPVRYWDERFSTVAAERSLLEADLRRDRRRRVVNQVAAALILQSYLDSEAARAEAAGPGRPGQ
jgi:putative Holliday junction resolvase